VAASFTLLRTGGSLAYSSGDIGGPPKWRSSRFGLAYLLLFGNACIFFQRISFSMVIVCMVNHTAVSLQERTTNHTLTTTPAQNFVLGTRAQNSTHSSYRSNSEESHENTSLSFHSLVYNPDGERHGYTTAGPGSGVTAETASETDRDQCGKRWDDKSVEEKEDGPFVWDKEMQGLLLGAIYWGYMLFQVIGGYLFYYGGPRLVCGVSMVFMSVCNVLCHPAAYWSPWAVFVLRVIIGICTSFVIPSMFALWGKWAPIHERATLISLSFSGQNMANALVFPTAALLCKYGFAGGWPSVFYVFASLSLVWCVLWFLLASDSPETHGRIDPEERDFILKHRPEASYNRGEKILTSLCFWAMVSAHVSFTWGLFLFLSNLPIYMREVMRFDIKSNGVFSMLPYIALGTVQFCGGFISDAVVRRKLLNVFWSRRMFCVIANIIPAVLLLIMSYLDCTQKAAVMTLLVIAVGVTGFAFSAFLINPFDIAPRYAISISSVSNSFACIPGILTPYVVAEVTKDKTREQWQIVFFITAGIFLFGTVFFCVFAKTSVQPWAVPKQSVITMEFNAVNGHVTQAGEGKDEEEKDDDECETQVLFDGSAS
ncbi:hypothetical protein BaRGS_00031543, partial [Batillaria attramentaria]